MLKHHKLELIDLAKQPWMPCKPLENAPLLVKVFDIVASSIVQPSIWLKNKVSSIRPSARTLVFHELRSNSLCDRCVKL